MSAAILGMALWSFTEDYWTVETGMLSWAEVLAEHFKSLGGELRLNHKVDRILTRNGRAVGVNVLGEDVAADYVISASDYKKTFLDLLDDQALVPRDMREKIETAAVSEGIFTVYLGLNLPQERLRDYLGVPHVYYSPEGLERNIYDAGDADYFEKSGMTLYSPSLLNEGLSPENKSSLMLQTMAPHRWMNNWGGGDREVYRELKNKVNKQMIAKAAALIPDIETWIEFEDAATPLTYERYTFNSDGATSAWSWNPGKKFFDRGMGPQIKTPVGDLFIGSCWAFQIGGVPGAISAALACAKVV
jgi:phytoene dehydrogenase-like protein